MPKATPGSLAAIDDLLDRYKHSATIPKGEREAALKKAWPTMTKKHGTNLEAKFDELRAQGLTKVKAIAQMYRDGYAAAEIAKGAHVNRGDVLAALHFQGLAINQKNVYQNVIVHKLERVRKLTGMGYTRAEVAEKIGVTRGQLTTARVHHKALAKAFDEGDEAWQERKAEIRTQTKKERINYGN